MYTFDQTYLTPQNDMITIKKSKSFSETINELNKEFDESIYFNHHYTALRKLEVEKPISPVTIPLLMDCEFLFSCFEEKMITKEADKETQTQILGHIKQFMSTKDLNFIRNFLDNIKTYAEIIGIKNTSDLLVPALAKIVDESLNVKIKFLENLLPFIDYLCSSGDEGINILKNNMINIVQELYSQKKEDYNSQMKRLLFKNFVKIAKNILPYDTNQSILNIIIAFGNEDNVRTNMLKNKAEDTQNLLFDEHKILCIRYIRNLAEGLGKDNTERYLLPQLISFTIETNVEIKKELLITLPIIAEIISVEFISSKIYDILRRISIDLNANLRKVCIISIAKIIKIFKTKCQEIKNIKKDDKKYSAKNFVTLVENLSKDKDDNVRYKIIEKIGEIIAPLDKEELSLELFQFYRNLCTFFYKSKIVKNPLGATYQEFNNPILNKMKYSGYTSGGAYAYLNDEDSNDFNEINNMENDYHRQITEKELSYYFAYNFPAILYCYGNQHWSDLKEIYYGFCFEEDLAIRLSIISSFHEIANIVGKEITEKELLLIYDKFLESNDNYEQKLAIKNLPQILIKVDKKIKEKYYKYFEPVSIFIDNTGNKVRHFNFMNWKNKLNVIEGILCYYNLYDNDIIYNSILPQCITFSLDKYYKVRKTSSKVLASILLYLYYQDYKKDKIMQTIKNFAFHKKFKFRINFIKFLPVFLQNKDFYQNEIKNIIKIIVLKDKIMDVRIALAKVLIKIISNEKDILYNDEDIHKFCANLNENKIISKIFDGVKINNSSKIEDNLEDKKYFVEENKYFFDEFKIEFEKKDNNNMNKKTKNETKEGNETVEEKKDEKIEEEKVEEKKEEIVNEVKQEEKKEEPKEEKKEEVIENKEIKIEEQKTENKNEDETKNNEEIKNDIKTEENEEEPKEEPKEEQIVEQKEEKKEENQENTKKEKKEEEHKEEEIKEIEKENVKIEEPKEKKEEIQKEEVVENKEENKEQKEEQKEEEHKEEDKKDLENKEEPKENIQNKEQKNDEEKEKPKENEETEQKEKKENKEEEKKENEEVKEENKEANNENQNKEENENNENEEKKEVEENNDDTEEKKEGEEDKKDNNKKKRKRRKK